MRLQETERTASRFIIPAPDYCYTVRETGTRHDPSACSAQRVRSLKSCAVTATDDDVGYKVCMLKRDYQLFIIINVPSGDAPCMCVCVCVQKYEWAAVTMPQGTTCGGRRVTRMVIRRGEVSDGEMHPPSQYCNKDERARAEIDRRQRRPSPAYILLFFM